MKLFLTFLLFTFFNCELTYSQLNADKNITGIWTISEIISIDTKRNLETKSATAFNVCPKIKISDDGFATIYFSDNNYDENYSWTVQDNFITFNFIGNRAQNLIGGKLKMEFFNVGKGIELHLIDPSASYYHLIKEHN